MKFKKGQEEMMGFVLIVMIVVVMGVVFLLFSVRQSAKSMTKESTEMSDLVDSILYYTTDCQSASWANLSVKEVMQGCSNGKSCMGGPSYCTQLNTTLSGLLPKFRTELELSRIHGWNLSISNLGANADVGPFTGGNTTSGNSFTTSRNIPNYPFGEDIKVSLKCWVSQSAP